MLRIALRKTNQIGLGVSGVRYISNYYKLFPQTFPNGPPPSGPFDVDVKKLRNEYIRAQQQAHPDVSDGQSHVSSAELSTAYKVLKDPVSRAEHILDLRGANPLQEGASLDDEELLMDIMMSREHVSEAESLEELDPVIEQNEARWIEAQSTIAKALENDDLPTAQAKLIELTYWSKLRQAIDEKSEELSKAHVNA